MNKKQQLYNKCQEVLNNRLEVIQNTIKDIQNALHSETKSSAGDKHETGTAMLQLEREKAGNQLPEIQKSQEILQKIDPDTAHQKVALGSIVYTSNLNYFIGISAGEIIVNSGKFYAISPSTPIARLLLSKMVGEQIQFRNSTFTIIKIE